MNEIYSRCLDNDICLTIYGYSLIGLPLTVWLYVTSRWPATLAATYLIWWTFFLRRQLSTSYDGMSLGTCALFGFTGCAFTLYAMVVCEKFGFIELSKNPSQRLWPYLMLSLVASNVYIFAVILSVDIWYFPVSALISGYIGSSLALAGLYYLVTLLSDT